MARKRRELLFSAKEPGDNKPDPARRRSQHSQQISRNLGEFFIPFSPSILISDREGLYDVVSKHAALLSTKRIERLNLQRFRALGQEDKEKEGGGKT